MANDAGATNSLELTRDLGDQGSLVATHATTIANVDNLNTHAPAASGKPTSAGTPPSPADQAAARKNQEIALSIAATENVDGPDEDEDLDLMPDESGDDNSARFFAAASGVGISGVHRRVLGTLMEESRRRERKRLAKEANGQAHEPNVTASETHAPKELESLRAAPKDSIIKEGIHGAVRGVVAAVAARAVMDGFTSYMAGRVESAVLQNGETRGQTAVNAARSTTESAIATAAYAATGMIPGVTSYREFEAGNYASAGFWAVVDGAGVAAFVLTFGFGTPVIEGLIGGLKATKHLANLAKAAEVTRAAATSESGVMAANAATRVYREGNYAYAVYTVGETTANFVDFLATEKGQTTVKALYQETIGHGMTPETMAEFIHAQMPPGAPPQVEALLRSRVLASAPIPEAVARSGRGGGGQVLRAQSAAADPQVANNVAPKPAPVLTPPPPSV